MNATTDSASGVPTTIGVVSSVVDNDRTLKKTWLNLLPVEQVVEIVLKLDEHAPLNLRKEIWPQDLKAAVFNAAVATIMESSGKGKAVDLSGIIGQGLHKSPEPPDSSRTTDVDEPPSSKRNATQQAATKAPVASTSALPTPPATTAPHHQVPAASTAYPYTYSYPGYPYAYQQPYPYPYPPVSYSPAPPRPPVVKGRAGSKDEEDDLPSYEEMLVQALTEYNDPCGIAPKQLFQWMAAHYPLQANFRPSASQALQKAYKRGRFEKNKEGKYRLSAAWEGGNTSKRTTRRPQSYAQAAANPSPSAHPPPDKAASYSHYPWTYQQSQQLKTQSQTPPPPQQSHAQLDTITETAPLGGGEVDTESHREAWEAAQSILQALNFGVLLKHAKPDSEGTDIASKSAQPPSTNADSATCTSALLALSPPVQKAAIYFPPPVFAGDISVGSFGSSSSSVPASLLAKYNNKNAPRPPPMAALLPTASFRVSTPTTLAAGSRASSASADMTETSNAPRGSAADRASLQGSLALLAAQLADLARSDDDAAEPGTMAGTGSSDWPSLAESASASATASVSTALNMLDGLGMEMFGESGWSGLRGVGVDA